MKISTKGRYALAVLIESAKNSNDEYISLKKISEGLGISMKYLEQIVQILVKNNLLNVSRGKQGGYKLSKDISNYTIGEVLTVTEKNIEVIKCLSNSNDCKLDPNCKRYRLFKGLDDVIKNYLNNVKLEEIM